MDSSIPLDKLLQPIGLERFYAEYKGKKHFVIKSKENIFANHFSCKNRVFSNINFLSKI